jgi:hypothetical protein
MFSLYVADNVFSHGNRCAIVCLDFQGLQTKAPTSVMLGLSFFVHWCIIHLCMIEGSYVPTFSWQIIVFRSELYLLGSEGEKSAWCKTHLDPVLSAYDHKSCTYKYGAGPEIPEE